MGRIVPLQLLGPTAGTYKRQDRHNCHCGTGKMLDLDGICQRCGRFPSSLIAVLNEDRKSAAAERKRRGKR